MRFPIWVPATELECCQPDATVGEPWTASVVALKEPQPWWVKHSPEPVSDEVLSMGVVEVEGTAASSTMRGRSSIVHVGGLRVILPGERVNGTVRRRGRLWLEVHGHPELQGVPGLQWNGTVRGISGIRLEYRPVTVYLAIPVRQEPPVRLVSTSDRRDPAMLDRGFSEFLIDLEV